MENQVQKKSEWTGSVLGLLGCSLIVSFLSITVILLPWGITHFIRYIAEHMRINGQRITFDGTGGQLFGTYIKWCFLCIITLGIYSFWIPNNLWQWITKHMAID